MIPEITASLLGGFVYRIRGGMFNDFVRDYLGKPPGWEVPNLWIRSLWAVYATLCCVAFSGEVIYFITAPLWYLGIAPGYFGGEFNLEAKENRNPKNYMKLCVRGAFIAFPAAIATGALGGVAAGMFLPFYYLAGLGIIYLFKPKWKELKGFSQLGELLTGIAVIAGTIATI